MKLFKFFALVVISLLFITGCAAEEDKVDLATIYFVAEYDPARDPAADLEQAIEEAQTANKHILLEIGGDWCSWCHILDDYVQGNQEVADKLHQNFVVIKVNHGEENYNDAFLEQYPSALGYPHFYVLNQQGEFIHSQSTGVLEEGRSYNDNIFLAFLDEWGP